MGREPRSHQRSVALAGIDVDISINVLAIAVNDVFTSECVVLLKRFIRPKAVGIDSPRLLAAVSQQESDCRFIGGFRWDHVPLIGPAISQDKHWRLVLVVCSTPARGQATRARRLVALAAFESGFHVQLVDLNRVFELGQRRVQRPQEALDAPVDRLVGNVDLYVELSETCVEADIGVDSEEPLFQSNC